MHQHSNDTISTQTLGGNRCKLPALSIMFLNAQAPRRLIVWIAMITIVPLAILLWLGWRLISQDRILEAQRGQERVDRAADLVVASLQRAFSSSEQRLAAGAQDWRKGAVSIVFTKDRVQAYPADRVAYLPVVPPLHEPLTSIYGAGEDLEFRKQDHAGAIEIFRRLTQSSDAAVRAGALLRLGRNLAQMGRIEDALAAYEQLESFAGVTIGGAPASLIGHYALCELLATSGRAAQLRAEVQRFANELYSGRWLLTGPVYWLYDADISKWTGRESGARRESEVFAEAVELMWDRRQSLPLSGREAMDLDAHRIVVLWQRSQDALRVLVAGPDFVKSEWLSVADSLAADHNITYRVADEVLTQTPTPSSRRTAKQTDLPWNLVITSNTAGDNAEFALRRRLLIGGFVLLVGMALIASYVIIRAVHRELAVARLQSDFVAAVSHEFRTPLTTLRQFTDMLREHERFAPSEGKERRLVCYEAQSRATDRLTKLVESLLDFGRMEAGVRRYEFEVRDCSDFIRHVVDDFRATTAAGTRIEFSGTGSVPIEADTESLSRAIWNLLDNAVKYSPDNPTIEVGVHRRGEDVCIDVRDYGIGVPANERAVIFAKFHRGQQPRTRGIKGTGIGLTMVDEIVRAHRGRVELTSEPGKGSTFTVVLPVKRI